MIKIESTANVASQGIKCLVYGQAGVGKTVLCSTAPSPLIISAEAGLLSLRKCNLPFIAIHQMTDLIEICKWLVGSAEARHYYTVCLDSASEVMETLLESEKQRNKDPRKAYGELADQGMKIARFFRDLPNKAVAVLCKEEFSKDESTGVMMYGPLLPGSKLGMQLPYFFDEVFQLVAGNQNQRALRCQRSFQHVAKDRSGMLAEWEEANLTKIFTKILS